MLYRLGFSYKKPQVIPGKADDQAQNEFLSYLEGLKESKNENDPILYVDGVHPQHNSHPDYGWMKKGKSVELKTNTGRKRVTINGALDLESKDIIIQEDQILNAENTIKFFKKIERQYPEATTINLILDNAGYYKGIKIREFLEESKIQVAIHEVEKSSIFSDFCLWTFRCFDNIEKPHRLYQSCELLIYPPKSEVPRDLYARL